MSPPAKLRKLGTHHGSSPSIGLVSASAKLNPTMPGPWDFKNQQRANLLVFNTHHTAYDVGVLAKCNGNEDVGGTCKKYLALDRIPTKGWKCTCGEYFQDYYLELGRRVTCSICLDQVYSSSDGLEQVQQLAVEVAAGRPTQGQTENMNWILDQLCPQGRPPQFKGNPPLGPQPLAFGPASLVAKLQRGEAFTAATPQQIFDEAERMRLRDQPFGQGQSASRAARASTVSANTRYNEDGFFEYWQDGKGNWNRMWQSKGSGKGSAKDKGKGLGKDKDKGFGKDSKDGKGKDAKKGKASGGGGETPLKAAPGPPPGGGGPPVPPGPKDKSVATWLRCPQGHLPLNAAGEVVGPVKAASPAVGKMEPPTMNRLTEINQFVEQFPDAPIPEHFTPPKGVPAVVGSQGSGGEPPKVVPPKIQTVFGVPATEPKAALVKGTTIPSAFLPQVGAAGEPVPPIQQHKSVPGASATAVAVPSMAQELGAPNSALYQSQVKALVERGLYLCRCGRKGELEDLRSRLCNCKQPLEEAFWKEAERLGANLPSPWPSAGPETTKVFGASESGADVSGQQATQAPVPIPLPAAGRAKSLSRRAVSVLRSQAAASAPAPHDPKPEAAYEALVQGKVSASSHYYNAAMAEAAGAGSSGSAGPPAPPVQTRTVPDISDLKGGSNEPGWRRVWGKAPNVREPKWIPEAILSQDSVTNQHDTSERLFVAEDYNGDPSTIPNTSVQIEVDKCLSRGQGVRIITEGQDAQGKPVHRILVQGVSYTQEQCSHIAKLEEHLAFLQHLLKGEGQERVEASERIQLSEEEVSQVKGLEGKLQQALRSLKGQSAEDEPMEEAEEEGSDSGTPYLDTVTSAAEQLKGLEPSGGSTLSRQTMEQLFQQYDAAAQAWNRARAEVESLAIALQAQQRVVDKTTLQLGEAVERKRVCKGLLEEAAEAMDCRVQAEVASSSEEEEEKPKEGEVEPPGPTGEKPAESSFETLQPKRAKQAKNAAKKSKMKNSIIDAFAAQMELSFDSKDVVDGPKLLRSVVHMVAQYSATTGKAVTPLASSFVEVEQVFAAGGLPQSSSSSSGAIPRAESAEQQAAWHHLAIAGQQAAQAAAAAAKAKATSGVVDLINLDEVINVDDEKMSRQAQKRVEPEGSLGEQSLEEAREVKPKAGARSELQSPLVPVERPKVEVPTLETLPSETPNPPPVGGVESSGQQIQQDSTVAGGEPAEPTAVAVEGQQDSTAESQVKAVEKGGFDDSQASLVSESQGSTTPKVSSNKISPPPRTIGRSRTKRSPGASISPSADGGDGRARSRSRGSAEDPEDADSTKADG